MDQKLSLHRKNAADLSLGASHQVIYSRALSLMLKQGRSAQHLDFGAGRGLFIAQLLQVAFSEKLVGVDLMDKPKNIASAFDWKQEDLNLQLSFPKSTFDSISALEIIEHLENPRHVFRELYRILRPGGWVIVSTPNNESWRAILSYTLRGHFVAFTGKEYPAHITALNRVDLLRASQEAGFVDPQFAFSNFGSVPAFTRMTWQKISLGMLKNLRFSDNLFLILRKP